MYVRESAYIYQRKKTAKNQTISYNVLRKIKKDFLE